MKVFNQHRRIYSTSKDELGKLIDTLSSENDLLWPHKLWPKMKFDKPLCCGANGGHGPIRYFVEEYQATSIIKFRFTGPSGFNGYHQYEVIEINPKQAELIHTLEMNTSGFAIFSWPLIYQPLHDALIEDSLSFSGLNLGMLPHVTRWSLWTKILRWIISKGRGRAQKF